MSKLVLRRNIAYSLDSTSNVDTKPREHPAEGRIVT